VFSEAKLAPEDLNAMYNVADVVVNIASNEGWGLSSTEAMLSGTPIINNVTGGLQDQCGFIDDDPNGCDWIRFNKEFPTNHTGKFKTHGVWAKPVFPSNRSLQGSVPTPYIFDDRCQPEDVADAMHYWWDMNSSRRDEMGEAGRNFCLLKGLTSKAMADKMGEMLEFLMQRGPVNRPRYTVTEVQDRTYENIGIA
jgi:glycosyltransferase involved in cell wall biosynthesis